MPHPDAALREGPAEEGLPEALEEEEEEETSLAQALSLPSMEEEKEEEERPGSGRHLQLFQEPSCAGSLAESALEDGEPSPVCPQPPRPCLPSSGGA